MKKILVMAALAALVSSSAFAVISGSDHDLRAYSPGSEMCVFCHTPHGADTNVSNAPLWNRSTANATGSVYTSLTLNASANLTSINATDAPLCLSCHDGSVADSLKNEPNSGQTNATAATVAAAANLTTDLSNDHPIGFSYDAVDAADTEIVAIGTVTGLSGMTGAFYGGSNNMWCSSCHDVHDQSKGAFLRINNSGSNLCLACHSK